MISFTCPCGYRFSLPDEMAGGTIQCPRCKRLNDVPSLNDLKNLNDDGTFKLDTVPLEQELSDSARMARLREAFGPGRDDAAGGKIDMRQTLEEVRRTGEGVSVEPARIPRRYDPETGELVVPLGVMSKPTGPGLPRERPAGPSLLPHPVVSPANYGPVELLAELCRPVNLAVMLFALLGYALAQFVGNHPKIFMGMDHFASLFILLVMAAFAAHYAITVEETGPNGQDELPRPLRDFDFGEDLWRPFYHLFGSLMVAYAPSLLVRELVVSFDVPVPGAVQLAVWVGCGIIFPAVFLTFVTSGSIIVNLRPDRVLRVMGQSGGAYWLAALGWFLSGGLTYWLVLGAPPGAQWTDRVAHRLWMDRSGLEYALLIPAVYLTHWFCWQLGLIYRRYHEEFQWAYQRHIPTNRIATLPEQVRRTSTVQHMPEAPQQALEVAPSQSAKSLREVNAPVSDRLR